MTMEVPNPMADGALRRLAEAATVAALRKQEVPRRT